MPNLGKIHPKNLETTPTLTPQLRRESYANLTMRTAREPNGESPGLEMAPGLGRRPLGRPHASSSSERKTLLVS